MGDERGRRLAADDGAEDDNLLWRLRQINSRQALRPGCAGSQSDDGGARGLCAGEHLLPQGRRHPLVFLQLFQPGQVNARE